MKKVHSARLRLSAIFTCLGSSFERLGAKNEHSHGVWKSTEKVSFNIASEASYVYILSGQKLIKNAKNSPFRRVFEDLKLAVNSVTRQVSFNRTKIGGKCQNWKIQMRHFELFSNNVHSLKWRRWWCERSENSKVFLLKRKSVKKVSTFEKCHTVKSVFKLTVARFARFRDFQTMWCVTFASKESQMWDISLPLPNP